MPTCGCCPKSGAAGESSGRKQRPPRRISNRPEGERRSRSARRRSRRSHRNVQRGLQFTFLRRVSNGRGGLTAEQRSACLHLVPDYPELLDLAGLTKRDANEVVHQRKTTANQDSVFLEMLDHFSSRSARVHHREVRG